MKNFIFYIAVLGFLASGCEETTEIPLKGDVVGFVTLLDENGKELTDKSGAKVSIDEDQFTFTDTNGRFELQDVNAGNYNFTFEKEGFGTFKRFSVGLAGGSKPAVISNINLVEFPSLEITSLDVETQSDLVVRVSGKMTETSQYKFTFYFGKDASVSNRNYESDVRYSVCCLPMTGFDHHLYMSPDTYYPGQKIYMVVYASAKASQNSYYGYYDPETSKYIEPSEKKLTTAIELVLK